MENLNNFITDAVTCGIFYFSDEIEIFTDKNQKEHYIKTKLSNGSSEKENPLPMINAISTTFFEFMKQQDFKVRIFEDTYNCEYLGMGKHLVDKYIFDRITWEAAQKINIFQNVPEENFGILDPLMDGIIKRSKNNEYKIIGIYPFVFKIVNLLVLTATYYFSEHRYINHRLLDWHDIYIDITEKKLANAEIRAREFVKKQGVDFSVNLVSNLPIKKNHYDLFDDFVSSVRLKQVYFIKDKKNLRRTLTGDVTSGLGLEYVRNPMEIAWAELMFAQQLKMPATICTFCGKVYRLEDSKGRINKAKSTCGSFECKKALRQQITEYKMADPKEAKRQKEMATNRQRKKRAKDKALSLYKEGKTVAEISGIIKYPPTEIHDWITKNN
ncbi:hypothetical protein [Bacillus sp. Hm123]|uniref:hypothetical protein n=1 Tax=Bacillus sp. Hm123 TaxID=3450745 RepID=UPI003F4279B5